MSIGKTRKCKTCGRPFQPKAAGDAFCSPLCRTAGCFIGGGGNTAKPLSPEQRKAMEKKERKQAAERKPSSQKPKGKPGRPKSASPGEKPFPRVHHMFTLPLSKRFAVSKKFTPEEAEYCRRLMKRKLIEEFRMDEAIGWEMPGCEDEGLGSYEGITGGVLGESDDGSI